MEGNGLVGRIKSARIAIAVGVLAVVAGGGGAYYYLVYLQEIQSGTVAANPPVAGKPLPSPAKPAAKPANVQPTVPASAVPAIASPSVSPAVSPAVFPAVSPAVSPAQQPVATPAPDPVAPVSELAVEPAKPEPALQKDQPEKRRAATRPEQVAKAEQVAEQVEPQAQDVLLAPAPAPVEPVSVASSGSVAPGEPVSVAAGEPLQRGVITPKYNDVMTAVLRGDREAARELLDLGWWVDKPSANGITPLMAAVMNRDTQMVQLLLDYGAEPSAQALRLARKNKDAATAALLERRGAR